MSVPGQGPVPELAMQQAGATAPLQELALLQPQYTAPSIPPQQAPSLPVLTPELTQQAQAIPTPGTAQAPSQPQLMQPQGIPAATPVPATAPTADPVQQSQQNLQQTKAIGQERVANAQEAQAINVKAADDKAKFDEAHAAAMAKLQADHAKHRATADAEIAKKRAAFESTPWTSHWESRTAGQKAMIGLGLLFSGISWNSNHVNRGVEILNQATQEHLALQKERHKDLWNDIQLSMEGKKDLNAMQLQELSQWQAQEAARWQAIASRTNQLIVANKGRSDVTAAKTIAQEATDKATQHWENSIKAKATALHMDAETLLTKEQIKTQASIRAKNYAEAANARAMAANGGMDKFTQQMLARVPMIVQRDPDYKALYGTTSTPGALPRLDRVQAAQKAIREAVEAGDTTAAAVAVTSAREQLTRFLTGVSPTKTSVEMVEALKGTDESVKTKIGRLLGNPQEGEKFIHTIYKFLDESREQALTEIDKSRQRMKAKHQNPKNPLYQNPHLRAEIDANIDGLFSGVIGGDGKARYGEGQTGEAGRLNAAAAQPHAPAHSTANAHPDRQLGDRIFKWNGTAYVEAN